MKKLEKTKSAIAAFCVSAILVAPTAAYASKAETRDAEYQAFYDESNKQLKPVEYLEPNQKNVDFSDELNAQAITKVANQVANWQLNQFDIRSNMMRPERRSSGLPEGWIYGALHVGLMAWAEASEQASMEKAMYNLALLNEWRMGPRPYNADDHVVGDVYLDLYQRHGGEEKIYHVKKVFDWIVDNPSEQPLKFDKSDEEVVVGAHRKFRDPWCKQRWCWADAIFMAPPVWAHLSKITGDQRYLDFMNDEFWETTDYLYNKDEKLYLRDSRYFDRKDDQGRLIYWGRGNGWVYAGLARTLEHIPQDYKDRPRYEKIFKDMGARLIDLQLENGSWPSSLLDQSAAVTPESSGTGLLIFGLAWGVNNGLLDAETYTPVVLKGWQSLVDSVAPSGRIGWVQQVAFAPGSATSEDTQLYGTGALLLAASEVLKIAKTQQSKK